jgi:hypothetical protein
VSRGEFRVEGGKFRVEAGKFRVEGGKFRVEGGIPCREVNSMSTEFRGHPAVHPVEKNFKKCFYYKYLCFFFFFKML